MATNPEYIEYVVEQLSELGNIKYKKMFGEYMIYQHEKPVLLVCNSTVFAKKLDIIKDLMYDAKVGLPYKNAKEHYILDIDNKSLSQQVVTEIEKVTPLPKKKTKKL